MVDLDRLNKLIAEKGVSKKFLSEKAGKARTYISCAMCGKGTISAEALKIFARELGTTVEYLRGETDEPNKKEMPLINGDEELTMFLEELRNRPEQRMLLSVTKDATKAEVEAVVEFITKLRKGAADD